MPSPPDLSKKSQLATSPLNKYSCLSFSYTLDGKHFKLPSICRILWCTFLRQLPNCRPFWKAKYDSSHHDNHRCRQKSTLLSLSIYFSSPKLKVSKAQLLAPRKLPKTSEFSNKIQLTKAKLMSVLSMDTLVVPIKVGSILEKVARLLIKLNDHILWIHYAILKINYFIYH